MPGPTLGRYRLSARVALGGMGEVFRGVDVGYGGIERPVAVKLIAPALACDPALKQQFVDEARLSYLLCHQNVVQVRDVGEIDAQLFIAMEWVEGADLGTLLARLQASAGQPLPLRFACLVAVEAARGLDYAHRLRDASGRLLNLVHRDVSPSNLLVSFEGEIKVSDFGIARSRMREATSLPGGLKGKIGYMAPEQARAEPLDARADVFALGAVLYELLTGHNAFTWQAKENEALERVRRARFAPVRTLAPTVPQGLEAIVLRAMAADRAQRYQSCAQMREDLESFARRESYALSPSDFGQFVRDLMEAPAAGAPEQARTATPVKRLSGSRAVAAPRAFNDALGGALAALGGGDDGGDQAGDDVAYADTAAAATLDAPTARGHKAVVPSTVALPAASPAPPPVQLHATIGAPDATTPPRPPTDLTDLIPRSGSRVPILVGAALLLVAGVAAAVWWARRPPTPEPVVTAPPPTVPTVVGAPPATVARPGVTPATTAPPSPAAPSSPATASAGAVERAAAKADKHRARAAVSHASLARLSVESDVAADAFVDGKYLRPTPIVDYELSPGRHRVRVESSAPGLRLIPREQLVELKPGESKQLRMDLK